MPDLLERSSSVVQSSCVVAPLGVWLVLQLLALIVSAARVPLSHHYPLPAESVAVEVMVAVQLAASAVLFPFLLRDARSTVVVASTALPMLAAAALLADRNVSDLGPVAGYEVAWLFLLAVWRRATRGNVGVSAGAASWAIGGVVLNYLQIEFGKVEAGASWAGRVLSGPIMAAECLVRHPGTDGAAIWFPILFLLILGVLVNVVRARQLIHQLIPH